MLVLTFIAAAGAVIAAVPADGFTEVRASATANNHYI
jgi:hypothetical protein